MKYYLRIMIILLVVCTIIASLSQAQTLPNSFNYQGRLTDTAGTPLPNGNYQMAFSIWDAATGGGKLWDSGNKTIPINKGLFTTSLGPVPATALPAAQTYLQVQIVTETPMPRIALGAVPYALRAVELLWPATASIASASPVLSLTNFGAAPAMYAVNTGTGNAGYFRINNTASTGSALVVNTNGGGIALSASSDGYGTAIYGLATRNGYAGYYETTGSTDFTTLVVKNKANGSAAYFDTVAGSTSALTSHTTGGGAAGRFEIVNAENTQPGLLATTTGSGPAIKATPGTGLAGLFNGTLQANSLKLPNGATNGYVLGSDAAGIGSWRKDGLTLPYSASATTAEDTFNLLNRGTGKTMWLGIDNANSTAPTLHVTGNHKGPGLLVDGQTQVGGFKMATGASSGYILKSDANGVGTWQRIDNTFSDLSVTGSLSAVNLTVDPNNNNTGTVNSGALRFGTSSGEGIFSKRTAGGNQYGLELATSFTSRLAITGAGNVGIGTNAPAHKLHVKGSQTGGYSTPMSYIENTNTTGNSAPALRLGGSGNSVDGVLNISNFGTGKVAVFGGTGGEVANIDTSGNLTVAGNVTVGGSLAIQNMPAVAFSNHRDDISWNHGDVKYLETIPVKAPANGYFVLDGAVTVRAGLTPAYDNAKYYLTLYDATNSGNKIYLESTAYLFTLTATSTNIVNEISQTVNWVYPVNKGQSVTFQLEGELISSSNPYTFHHNRSSLRVLFVPNQLTP